MMLNGGSILAQQAYDWLPPVVADHAGWWACAVAVVVGLGLFGWRDVKVFSLKRIWAISGVGFREAVRRRVLWITPVAILGLIVISQLQRPMDEQDAIRQTIKFCIFATGLVVTMAVIILACTNLPKEIESRVIYTVVTKPTTRLEIILGKIVGFARVSAVILAIMGGFTWGYLHLRAWSMQSGIARRMQRTDTGEVRRATLDHYQTAGLLQAKELRDPSSLAIFARLPGADGVTWIFPDEMSFAVPFALTREQVLVGGQDSLVRPVRIVGKIRIEERALTPEEMAALRTHADPLGGLASTEGGPLAPTTRPIADQPPIVRPVPVVQVTIETLDAEMLVEGVNINNGIPAKVDAEGRFVVTPSPGALGTMVRTGRFQVVVTGQTAGVLYGAGSDPLSIVIGPDENGKTQVVGPMASEGDPAKPAAVGFRGRSGNYGQQLSSGTGDPHPVAVYGFTGAETGAVVDGRAPLELRVGIERSGADVEADDPGLTHLRVTVHNRAGGVVSPAVDVWPETGRTSYFTVPADSVAGGDFEVRIENLSKGHWVGLKPASLWLVSDTQPFGYNIVKSMLILWLMSVLVIAISIFCGTFLSWPIAIVLTIVILLGHWGVGQLQGTLTRGIGNQIATDFGFTDPSKAKVVSSTVEALTAGLNALAPMLPDISQYSATEDIERGVAVPPSRLWRATEITIWFGLPLAVLAYIFLKYKEVAP